MKDISKAIESIRRFRETHLRWAEYFEANPDVEKEYVDTGEWDSAKEHREIIETYDVVLASLQVTEEKKGDVE